MDITVKPVSRTAWSLIDLLGRDVGTVHENEPEEFRIEPGERVADNMKAMKLGPYSTLDQALSAIETFTRSTCRLVAQGE